MNPEQIISPCVAVCSINQASGYCDGCGRSLDEIAGWGAMKAVQRQEIMDRLASPADSAVGEGNMN